MELNIERFVDGEFFGEADVDFDLEIFDSPAIEEKKDGAALLSINKLDFFPERILVGLLGELCTTFGDVFAVAVRYFEF